MNVYDDTWCGRVILKGVALGQLIINSFGFRFTAHPDDGTFPTDISVLEVLSTTFRAEVLAKIKDLLTPSMTYFQLEIQTYNPSRSPSILTTWTRGTGLVQSLSDVGLHAGDTGSTFDAAGIFWKSTNSTKRGRGQNRFGPLSEDTVNNNRIAPADTVLVDAIAAGYVAVWPATATAAQVPIVAAVLSLENYLVLSTPPGEWAAPIVSWYPKTYVTSQLSRKDRGYGL